jgi:hypothetical protein
MKTIPTFIYLLSRAPVLARYATFWGRVKHLEHGGVSSGPVLEKLFDRDFLRGVLKPLMN